MEGGMAHNLFLSIIIPAFNEEKRIKKAITKINRFLKTRKYPGEIIVVDDGSSDKTANIVKQEAKKNKNLKLISYQQNRGKGYAVKKGVLAGRGEIIAFTDTDLSAPIEQMEKLIKKINQGYDIAIGSRGARASRVRWTGSWIRKKMGDFYGDLMKILVLYGIKDTQCGFKAFKKQVAKELFAKKITPTVIFDMEILILAVLKKYKIAEVGVSWRHNPDTRIPYNFTKAIKIFIELLKLKKKYKLWLPIKANKC